MGLFKGHAGLSEKGGETKRHKIYFLGKEIHSVWVGVVCSGESLLQAK